MRKAVFLDRDGVINEVLSSRVKFVNKPEQFHLLQGVSQAIRQFNEAKIPTFVVTNQGGVGLGYMKKEALEKIHQEMRNQLKSEEAYIDDIAYCPHKPQAGCLCRKPGVQMLMDLAKKHDISLKESIMVGDREPDIQAGRKAGCKTVFIGQEHSFEADAYFSTLQEAAPWIIANLKEMS